MPRRLTRTGAGPYSRGTVPATPPEVLAYLDRNRERFVDGLVEFCRFASKASSSVTGSGVAVDGGELGAGGFTDRTVPFVYEF